MESQFHKHLGILQNATEATQEHDRNAILNEAYLALQEQQSPIESEVGAHLLHEAPAQQLQLRNAHLYLEQFRDEAVVQQNSANHAEVFFTSTTCGA